MRKSVGNRRTNLDAFEMLEGMVKDIDVSDIETVL